MLNDWVTLDTGDKRGYAKFQSQGYTNITQSILGRFPHFCRVFVVPERKVVTRVLAPPILVIGSYTGAPRLK